MRGVTDPAGNEAAPDDLGSAHGGDVGSRAALGRGAKLSVRRHAGSLFLGGP